MKREETVLRLGWIAAGAALVVLSGCSEAAPVVESAPAAVDARDYVALGDSYAAGLGGGNYADTSCLQSTDKSYPQLWIDAKGTDALGETVNKACSGAVISTVTSQQLTALTDRTGWVTLTVGGNDVGFVAGLQQCVLGSDQTCAQSVKNASGTMESNLPGALDKLYTQVRAKAPNAKVYVVGYPHLVADPGAGVACDSLNDARRKALNAASDTLSEVISTVVAKHPGFTYVDARVIFAGHEACTKDPWIHAIADDMSESFHPNADGYAAYAKVLHGVTG
ncbi:putative GDSL-like lipase/acylhydrolase [Actinoplanes missouriensis 431]|uniref:Putative GDSL-like lipase/acylhydrolase n=1 Tax=Actinoplanes missouriensis (strain ATCC 14538 / DSM 43046 / CBS 188.64 / JCM 3121 / NBRC 102363 / NCIMB 12654 / NRRL B-3342 / UNCC 431) TaxID=512565 RepID=I0H220_ACTM4|nr:putative GDSL-like lipase/acylhydrolase [Actinoplanes missouriensis 431]